MAELVTLVGAQRAVEVLGIRLVGVNVENGKKLLITLAFIVLVVLLARGLRLLARPLLRRRENDRLVFWVRQAIHLGMAALLLLGIASIWFDDPTRLATALGLITAGLAFALQKVVTAVAAYFVILRGKIFNVGDRIRMGGVRGDVVGLSFTQTTIMEMGQPPPVQKDDPAMWVQSRQYTGRLVTVTNAKIFDEPIYNYTMEFPFLWEEISVPIPYEADRARAERILQEVAERHTVSVKDLSREALAEMQRRYFLKQTEMGPKVYYRLTDNWLELTVRFIAQEHGVRELKDAMSRAILGAFEAAGIGLASATVEIVGLPPLRVQRAARQRARSREGDGQQE